MRDDDTASVGISVGSLDEAFLDQPGHTTSHARPRNERSGRQVGHAKLTAGARQLSEYVEIRQR